MTGRQWLRGYQPPSPALSREPGALARGSRIHVLVGRAQVCARCIASPGARQESPGTHAPSEHQFRRLAGSEPALPAWRARHAPAIFKRRPVSAGRRPSKHQNRRDRHRPLLFAVWPGRWRPRPDDGARLVLLDTGRRQTFQDFLHLVVEADPVSAHTRLRICDARSSPASTGRRVAEQPTKPPSVTNQGVRGAFHSVEKIGVVRE